MKGGNVLNSLSNSRINEYIEKVQNMKAIAGGTNKKCFYIDDYVLLQTDINEKDMEQLIKIEKHLKQRGVNLAQTLEYKTEGNENFVGYKEGYILQEKAKGQLLYERSLPYNMSDNEIVIERKKYMSTLRSLQGERQQFFDKFVSDWAEITRAGLLVDGGKTDNFFYEKGKQMNFIDLNIRGNKNIDLSEICRQMCVVLSGTSRYFAKDMLPIKEDVNKSLSQIFKKMIKSFAKEGLDVEQAKDIISSRFPEIDLEEKDTHKLELAPEGLSQAQIEKIQNDKDAQERIEEESAKHKEKRLEITNRLGKTAVKNDVKREMIKRTIDKAETEKQQTDLVNTERKRALFRKSRQGAQLSEEQRRLIEEFERQKIQAQDTYKSKKGKAKNQGQQH